VVFKLDVDKAMKNLLIFVSPLKSFYNWYEDLCKIQIETGLMMGWKKEDIILATNFDYEYMGVKSLVVPDNLYCVHRKRASKINVIYYLLENKIIKDLCWFHDFDAHQLQNLDEIENEISGYDMAMTDYGFSARSNTASFFFKPEDKDIMERTRSKVYRFKTNEETALDILKKGNINKINERCKMINHTYSLSGKTDGQFEAALAKSERPIKIININPRHRAIQERHKSHMSDELLAIFEKHEFI
jgi:hypothetical protein